ncbi:38393_t:CDS:1, partial [Gigaspora margarita]
GKSILEKTQARKEALLDAECGTLDYGIKEKIGTKMEGVKINISKLEHKENLSKEKFDKEKAEFEKTNEKCMSNE